MQKNNDIRNIVQEKYLQQILSDMDNGVMAISHTGKILYANKKMTEYFELASMSNTELLDVMASNTGENDGFWDAILDVVHSHGIHQQKQVSFVAPSGRSYIFHITGSYMSPISIPGAEPHNGVVITISDETKYELLLQKKHDSTIVLVAMLVLISLTNFMTELHTMFSYAFPHQWIARFTEITAFLCALIFLKFTSLTVSDFGILPKKGNIKREILESLGIAFFLTAAMAGAKLYLTNTDSSMFSPHEPFFDWASLGMYYIYYIFIVIFQEFLTRCVLQKSINRVLGEKYRLATSVIITTLLFGAVHIQHGLIYMLGASVLNVVLSIFYNRHNSLAGNCIIHYSIGIMGLAMNWVI